jgi:hypothetical protein
MACHEVAALRLGLMKILGNEDESEKAHELLELGELACTPGPLSALTTASDLHSLLELYGASLVGLSDRVARAPASDPKLPYLRSLVVLTKKVELELSAQIEGLRRMNRELEEMHDLVHELFPAGEP